MGGGSVNDSEVQYSFTFTKSYGIEYSHSIDAARINDRLSPSQIIQWMRNSGEFEYRTESNNVLIVIAGARTCQALEAMQGVVEIEQSWFENSFIWNRITMNCEGKQTILFAS